MPENIIKDCSYAELMLYEIIKSIRIFFSKRQILSNNFKQISIKKLKNILYFGYGTFIGNVEICTYKVSKRLKLHVIMGKIK